MEKGFTLIEILLIVGILAILLTLNLPLVLDFYKTQQLDTNSQEIIQTLRRAQLKAMSIENNSSFGIYVTNANYTLFKGSSFESRDVQYDESSDFPQVLTVSGLQQIVFSKFEGIPNATGTIILSNGVDSRIISINEIGRIDLE